MSQANGPASLGNSANNAARIVVPEQRRAQSPPSWKFAVIGDLGKRYEIFLRALAEMKKNDVRFVLIAGDLAYRKTAEQFEYLKLKVAQSGFDRPIFAAIGNEDAIARHDYNLFRRYLGDPSPAADRHNAPGFFLFGENYVERFAFVVPANPPHQALFIAFDNAFGTPSSEQVDWMEKILQQFSGQVRNIFLVGHVPIVRTFRRMQKVPSKEFLLPFERLERADFTGGSAKAVYELIGIDPDAGKVPLVKLPASGGDPLADPASSLLWKDYGQFYEMLKKFKITAVFSGHLHGYGRYQIGETRQFISGGGGARLQYPEARHHYLEVEIGESGVEVRPRLVSGKTGVAAKVEQVMIAEIFLVFRNHRWLYAIAFLWVGASVGLFIFFRKRI